MNTENHWETVKYSEPKTSRVLNLKVQNGDTIVVGQILLQYSSDVEPTTCSTPASSSTSNAEDVSVTNNNNTHATHSHPIHHHLLQKNVVRATKVGTIEKLLVKEGDILSPGMAVIEFSNCKHPVVMKDMCAECGADLREAEGSNRNQTAAVAMVHNIPELMVSIEQAQVLGKADEERLLKQRKLVLLVDLDQTLIHTTNDNIPSNLKDVFQFQLHGTNSPWYYTRLRPGTHDFLEHISQLYELHICTFGSRTYAHMIASFLDRGGKYFSHRILSRDECFNPTSKLANMKALFPCGDHMVVIIDDRDDVWNFAPSLIHVKPYHFFQHTGDINAPPGLAKHEFDDKEGFDIARLEEEIKKSQEDSTIKKKTDEQTEVAKPDQEVDTIEDVEVDAKKSQEDSTTKKEKDEQRTEVAKPDQEVDTKKSQEESTTKNKKHEQENEVAKPDQEVATNEDAVATIKDVEVETNLTVSEPKPEDGKGNSEETKEVSNPKEVPTSESTTENKETKSEDNEGLAKNSTEEKSDRKAPDTEGKVDVHDPDDYLLHLEDILKTIHNAYYTMYDQMKAENTRELPDMKTIIPYVRRKVLQGVNLVFSGVIPTMVPLEKTRPYLVAKSLGANVTDKIISKQENAVEATTHLVAARLGTAKIHEAKKCKNVHVVTPDWLWSCAERWERVDERLFPLDKNTSVHRKPPAHCSSPDIARQLALQYKDPEKKAGNGQKKSEPAADFPVYDPKTGKRVRPKPSAARAAPADVRRPSFSDTINPLMSFSTEDIADMDREVEDILNEGGIEEEEEDEETDEENQGKYGDYGQESAHKRKHADLDDEEEELSDKFLKGENLPSDVQDIFEAQEREEMNDNNDGEDAEWTDMAAALEREFLEEGE